MRGGKSERQRQHSRDREGSQATWFAAYRCDAMLHGTDLVSECSQQLTDQSDKRESSRNAGKELSKIESKFIVELLLLEAAGRRSRC